MQKLNLIRLTTALSAASLLAIGSAFTPTYAQDEAFGPGTGGGPEPRTSEQGPGPRGFRGLSEEERDILRAAHEKIKGDAELLSLREQDQALREAFRAKKRAALIKADPRVEAILDKLEKGRPTPEQLEKFRSVMRKVKDDPAVQEAREKMKAATTREEKKAAAEELRAVTKTAVAKIDPELAEKMPFFPPRHCPEKKWRKGSGEGKHQQTPPWADHLGQPGPAGAPESPSPL